MCQYFEAEFSNNHEQTTAEWICIRGVRQPSVAEAQEFLSGDSTRLGLPVTDVRPITEEEARSCYDFSVESQWPVFGV